ncbi:BZ3500_MvSof-1268-A1-R1_Chr12-3g03996 [Microbotryum saponariae]|uniref:BZ3500_MvSof-1268-A1-R1_Chr12-3g03996 protein n=1 Tax=Microbotryum saponariae TaxID=289078 RepID=A0A2X0MK32_9BASI|nr:BZ3500_MvSof-1268-A1-R1_Chr12-3g03996 [Microbotryum saponariae]
MTSLFRSAPLISTPSPSSIAVAHYGPASGAGAGVGDSGGGAIAANSTSRSHLLSQKQAQSESTPITVETATSLMIADAPPIATNSALNKVASASSSLYQNCRVVLMRLRRVPGFAERFLDGPATAEAEAVLGLSSDPVSRSLHTLRLGSSLCFLFNALGLDHQLEINPKATISNLKACQRGTAHFIMACKQDLKWPDGQLFAIHELYGQDTNGVVKVIHTVNLLLDMLQIQGALLEPVAESDPVKPTSGPSDERTMIVREILDSERKYVQDLEVLQDYQRQVQANEVLSQDQVHALFLNLNTLADFQRRVLIGVEANASRPPEEQHFGNLFLQMEEHFSIYEPYCANLTSAQELAMAENAALSRLAHVLDPISELAPLLIKPVQRICKYPLLIGVRQDLDVKLSSRAVSHLTEIGIQWFAQSLLKNTPEESPYHGELKAGHAAIMRVTDRVNEMKRREENHQALVDLRKRVEDWKGHDIDSFGELLLHDVFNVQNNDSEREYFVYLFERIILCCKEAAPVGRRSGRAGSVKGKTGSRKVPGLVLKGRIFVHNVTGTTATHRTSQNLLEIRWRGDVGEEAFTIKCRSEDVLKHWEKSVAKAVDEVATRRRTNHLSASRRSEMSTNPSLSSFQGDSMSSPYAWHGSMLPSAGPSSSNGDDSEFISESGRSTPNSTMYAGLTRHASGSIRSIPIDARGRVQAEDPKDSKTSRPPLILNIAAPSSVANGVIRLRPNASDERIASPAKLTRSKFTSGTHTPAHGAGSPIEQVKPSNAMSQPSPPRGPVLARTRSASSPVESTKSILGDSLPQVLDSEWSVRGGDQHRATHPYASKSSPVEELTSAKVMGGHKPGGTNSSATLASQSSATSSNLKRFSSSSIGTDRSSATSSMSTSQPATNGHFPSPSSLLQFSVQHETYPSGRAISSTMFRIKINFGNDTFIVVASGRVSHRELLDKVLKKLRLCGHATRDSTGLRLRYEDEDGDRILIGNDSDLQIALEDLEESTTTGQPTLVLFANLYA